MAADSRHRRPAVAPDSGSYHNAICAGNRGGMNDDAARRAGSRSDKAAPAKGVVFGGLRQGGLERDIIELVGRFNFADDGTAVVSSDYLEVVAVQR